MELLSITLDFKILGYSSRLASFLSSLISKSYTVQLKKIYTNKYICLTYILKFSIRLHVKKVSNAKINFDNYFCRLFSLTQIHKSGICLSFRSLILKDLLKHKSNLITLQTSLNSLFFVSHPSKTP